MAIRPLTRFVLRVILLAGIAIIGIALISMALTGCTLVLVTGDHDSVRDIEGTDSDLTTSRPARERINADQYLQRWRQPDPGHR